MNRYILMTTAYSYNLVLDVVDTDGPMPEVPADEPYSSWQDYTGNTTAEPGMKMVWNGLPSFVPTTATEREAMNQGRIQTRLQEAQSWLMFNPVQYKSDLGTASPAEEAALLAYKQYFVAVAEVKNQTTFPKLNWPVAPF